MLLRRTLLALAAALTVTPSLAHAQTPNPRVIITTTEGAMTVELYPDKAPITVANFLKYVDRKLYDGATFYRASKPKGQVADDYGTIQGGLQNNPKKVLPPIAHESTLKTGLKHTDGTISMGRHAPGTAQADWFICIGDMPYLDADPKDPSNPGFAAFGRMVEGKPVAEAILGQPTDPNAGVGAMKGEMLVKPVKIISIRRAPPPDPAAAPAPAASAATPAAPTTPPAPKP
ncbi:MAG TPA: peptidylprolyl isomerase [Phenylobacterium sp.]|jgi:peptidyl-prolyl cis-trans isomerase A (cyclophilin A)|uniref:peptidylprolyl isomerase n=1 Tax=Phenylobacterium sp. TaxID=1871053 RepID=UPI002D27BFC4|nr:peptidylprolyl isomerase [Phenylobacterium sp.]HZZ68196.1 peptidylprolyl isomerase [Phenylobacterium sp.]